MWWDVKGKRKKRGRRKEKEKYIKKIYKKTGSGLLGGKENGMK